MSIYKTNELFEIICNVINDGRKYVEVTSLDENGEDCSLYFSADNGIDSGIDYGIVDSIPLPSEAELLSPITFHNDDFCSSIAFTYQDVFALAHAIDNALEHGKECLKNPSISNVERDNIKSAMVYYRNLQAKFAKFRKTLQLESVKSL